MLNRKTKANPFNVALLLACYVADLLCCPWRAVSITREYVKDAVALAAR